MLPTTVPNGHHHSPVVSEKRGWAAYEVDDDDKWRKGDSWLAGWTRALPSLRTDDGGWRDVLSSFLGARPPRHGAQAPTVALPSVQTIRFVLLCSLWYMSSALSSNTGKAIMTRFRYPVTLTFVQFGFVAGYCLVFASPVLRFTTIRQPTEAIIRSTLPMALFQVFGHIFSSMAISRIPVSTVHTIKVRAPHYRYAADMF